MDRLFQKMIDFGGYLLLIAAAETVEAGFERRRIAVDAGPVALAQVEAEPGRVGLGLGQFERVDRQSDAMSQGPQWRRQADRPGRYRAGRTGRPNGEDCARRQ